MAGLFSTLGNIFSTVSDTCEMVSRNVAVLKDSDELTRNYMNCAIAASRQAFIEATQSFDSQAYANALDTFYGRTPTQVTNNQQPVATTAQTTTNQPTNP